MEEENKIEERYSWEGIKTIITFSDKAGEPIDSETVRFKFTYKDEAGNSCEVSFDGEKRVNNIIRDGELIVIFEPYTFKFGCITVEQRFYKEDADFKDGHWPYGGDRCLGIKII